LKAHGVDQQLDPFLVDSRIVIVDGFVEGKAVLEPRAAPALHENAQLQLRITLFVQQLLDFGCSGISEDQRRRRRLEICGFCNGIHLTLRGRQTAAHI
jgi:hypothetical protein